MKMFNIIFDLTLYSAVLFMSVVPFTNCADMLSEIGDIFSKIHSTASKVPSSVASQVPDVISKSPVNVIKMAGGVVMDTVDMARNRIDDLSNMLANVYDCDSAKEAKKSTTELCGLSTTLTTGISEVAKSAGASGVPLAVAPATNVAICNTLIVMADEREHRYCDNSLTI